MLRRFWERHRERLYWPSLGLLFLYVALTAKPGRVGQDVGCFAIITAITYCCGYWLREQDHAA